MTDTLRAVLDGSARYAALRGDNVEWLRQLPDASVDAVVTDPPYGLGKVPDMVDVLRSWLEAGDYKASGGGFMGRAWDAFVPGPATWREVYRVLKPGGHVLAFAGTRTWDAMSLSLRLAGFELRDTIADFNGAPALAWVQGQGFPKSRNLDGAWAGWGTALKPAFEPVLCARKPCEALDYCAIISENLSRLEHHLCAQPAKSADESLPPTQAKSARDGGAIAPASVLTSTEEAQESATGIGAADASSLEAGTLASIPAAVNTVLSTIWSWKSILDAAYSLASTSTTETASSLITDLQTWSLLLSKITPESMLQAASRPDGWSGLVLSADELSHAVLAKISSIRALSVAGLAISKGHISRQDAEGNSGAWEPILVFRKPLAEGTVAAQVLATGTGALHIDACRVAGEVPVREDHGAASGPMFGINSRHPAGYSSAGRWPSNLVLSHSPACVRVGTRRVASNGAQPAHYGMGYHGANGAGTGERYTRADPDGFETVDAWECAPDCPVAELDRQSGTSKSREAGVKPRSGTTHVYGGNALLPSTTVHQGTMEYGDAGGASRFFPTFAYVAKASRSEREAGLDHLPRKSAAEITGRAPGSAGLEGDGRGKNAYAGAHEGEPRANAHPTVKPIGLMRWLVRLVTPPGGLVLDPWMGSGSTGVAVMEETELAARFIGFELDADGHDYVGVASARIAYALEEASKPAPVAKRLHKQRVEKPASGSQVTRTSDDTFPPSKAASRSPATRRNGTRRRKPRAEALTYSLWGAPELWTEPVGVEVGA